MSEELKTEKITFKSLFESNEEDAYIPPSTRTENLTTHQIKTIQVLPPNKIKTQPMMPSKQVQVEVPVLPNTEIENNKSTVKGLKKKNSYYNYIPKFYLKEMKFAKWMFIFGLGFFTLTTILCGVLIGLSFSIWKESMNQWVLLLLIPVFCFSLAWLIVSANRYRNFYNEATTINFKNEKVLSINVQKVYRRLKTSYIDISYFCGLSYIIMLLIMLIDSICVMFYKSPTLAFADFYTPIKESGNYTYAIVFWASVTIMLSILIYHIFSLVSNYVRASNIDNFYNYQIVDPNEIKEIKKSKNRRDLFIFLLVIGTFIFLTWLIIHLVRQKNTTKVIVK